MKKLGFTLAEILITMSIIGVVAALTAPALIQDASNAKVGPALEKTKSAIELANQNILFQRRAGDLLAVTGQGDNADVQYLQLLAQNFQNSTFIDKELDIGIFEFRDRAGNIQSGTRKWSDANNNRDGANDATPKLVLADNVVISVNATMNGAGGLYSNFNRQWKDKDGNDIFEGEGEGKKAKDNGNLGQRGSYRGPLADLLIDLNGVKNGPNVYGRDIFFFTVDRSGVVIPDGSELFSDYINQQNAEGNRVNNSWDGNGDYRCNSRNNGVGTGMGCAGSILDNNRRVDYR